MTANLSWRVISTSYVQDVYGAIGCTNRPAGMLGTVSNWFAGSGSVPR